MCYNFDRVSALGYFAPPSMFIVFEFPVYFFSPLNTNGSSGFLVEPSSSHQKGCLKGARSVNINNLFMIVAYKASNMPRMSIITIFFI